MLPGGTTGLWPPGFSLSFPLTLLARLPSAFASGSYSFLSAASRPRANLSSLALERLLTSAWQSLLCVSHSLFVTHSLAYTVSSLDELNCSSLSEFSIARLNALLRFHLRPIYVVVFYVPIGKTHLGRDLALRCFQRLFLPHLATRPCI